jgi:toxin FitB
MILLDTDVVSEGMTRAAHPRLRAWLDAQSADTLFLSSISGAELLFGVGALPDGRRKDGLAAALADMLAVLARLILSFDEQAARCHGILAVKAKAVGKGFPTPDGYSAAIAAAAGQPCAVSELRHATADASPGLKTMFRVPFMKRVIARVAGDAVGSVSAPCHWSGCRSDGIIWSGEDARR